MQGRMPEYIREQQEEYRREKGASIQILLSSVSYPPESPEYKELKRDLFRLSRANLAILAGIKIN